MSSIPSISGVYTNTYLKKVYYGPACTQDALPEAVKLLSKTQKAFIITGQSLASKTDVVTKVEKALGSAHAGTSANIGQHAPVENIREALAVMRSKNADVIVAVGGGSPIDAAKAISFFSHDENAETKDNDDERSFLPIIAIPTTLSVAETTQNAGYSENNQKVGKSHPALVPRVIIYDAALTHATPQKLWLSTGMRAVDHAVELLYRPPDASPVLRPNALGALRELFYLLPATKDNPDDVGLRQRLQLVTFNSLWPESRQGALGLSHTLGHALGATYSIPHGITSCITLAGAIQITARLESTPLEFLLSLSDALHFIPAKYRGEGSSSELAPPPSILALQKGSQLQDTIDVARKQGVQVGQAVQRLIDDLGLHSTLTEYKVPRQDIDAIALHSVRGDQGPILQEVTKLLTDVYE